MPEPTPALWLEEGVAQPLLFDDAYPVKVALTEEDSPLVGPGQMKWFASVAAALAAASIAHRGWFNQIRTRVSPADAGVISDAAPRRHDWVDRRDEVRARLIHRKYVWDYDLGSRLLVAESDAETAADPVTLARVRSLRDRVVMVTGHRPQHLPEGSEGWIRSELARVMARLDPLECVSGLAVGTDTFWAQEALRQGRRLISYVPCPQQAQRWNLAAQREHRRLLAASAEVVTVAETYQKWALMERNDLMLRRAPVVVAVYWGATTGGTADTVTHAQAMGRPIIRINPLDRTTTIARRQRVPQGA